MFKKKTPSTMTLSLDRPKSRLKRLQQKLDRNDHSRGKWLAFFCASILAFSLLLYLLLGLIANQPAQHLQGQSQVAQPIKLKVDARNAIVVDAKTGQVLGKKNSQQQIGIASQSKMLTAYGVLQEIKEKRFNWDTLVEITPQSDWSKKDNATFAHLEISAGQKLPVSELFAAMFTSSANDAALALADFAKDSHETQQHALERWAKQLKLTGSKWYNAAGQVNGDASDYEVKTAKADAENTASAEQLAILAYQDLQAYPGLRTFYEKRGLVYHPTANETKIKLTEAGKFDQEIKGKLQNPQNLTFEGLKTGSTPASGGALTGLVKDSRGREFITVVSGAGAYTDQVHRYQATIDVVNQVENQFDSVSFKAGQPLGTQQTIKNLNMKSGQQAVVLQSQRMYWLKKGQTKLGYYLPKSLSNHSQSKGTVVAEINPALKTEYLPTVAKKTRQLTLATADNQPLAHWWQKAHQWSAFWQK
ncbi:serine hydrolase [Fructobacillus pseudoficulneus]|uniref:serine hydrolase n=1 Tax=Fructobacillus pseudoficulneus TaxID=220714 RepID=UPI0009E391E1|nr:serine hydrolase [Fructobacillus pseudoficulneus]